MSTIDSNDNKSAWSLRVWDEFVRMFDSLEVRSLRRVFVIWGALFCITALSLPRYYGEFRVQLFTTICCLGLVMSATWTCLYREVLLAAVLQVPDPCCDG